MGAAAVPPEPVHPFWSAAVQQEALGLAEPSQLGPREGSQVMVTPVHEVQAAATAVSSVPAPAVSPAPAVKAATSVSQDPVRSVGLAVSPVPGVGGKPRSGGPSCVGSGRNPKTGDAGGRGGFCERCRRDPVVSDSFKWHGWRTDLGWSTVCSNWRLGVGSGRWRSTKPSTGWKAANSTAWDSVWLSFGKSGNTCAARIRDFYSS